MGFYSRRILPRLIDLLMSNPAMRTERSLLLGNARGRTLEIGFGTGLNLPHYPAQIQTLAALDANPGMSRLARRRILEADVQVEHAVINAERLPMPDASFDTVVSTWTLCSIANVEHALAEIRRVLKPDGRFLFIEHGLSEDPEVSKWQHRLTPLQKRIADGCHLDRDIEGLIRAQGLEFESLRRFYMDRLPRTGGYTYRGIAVKREN